MDENPWKANVEALGEFIHAQRKMAEMSLRDLSEVSELSNAYLSQIERGLHEPSMRAVNQIAQAFNMSTETMLRQAGLLGDDEEDEERPTTGKKGKKKSKPVSTPDAIRADPALTDAQKEALLAVYRGFGIDDGSTS